MFRETVSLSGSFVAVDTLSVEAQLVERAKAQDEAAFEQIMSLYADRLYNYILRMVGNATDAEDLVQETFLRAYQGLPNFDGRASLGTWLYRIATNLCIDHQRRRARRVPTVSYSAHDDEDGEATEWDFPDLADAEPAGSCAEPRAGSGRRRGDWQTLAEVENGVAAVRCRGTLV
jgi:RNA polymerase sigma factor (sigma-70 family)